MQNAVKFPPEGAKQTDGNTVRYELPCRGVAFFLGEETFCSRVSDQMLG